MTDETIARTSKERVRYNEDSPWTPVSDERLRRARNAVAEFMYREGLSEEEQEFIEGVADLLHDLSRQRASHETCERPANVWRPLEMPEDSKIAYRDDVELFRSPAGRMWYRWRTDQEAAEMRLLVKEHSPNQDRMRDAQTVCPSKKALAQPPGCGYPACGCADITQCEALKAHVVACGNPVMVAAGWYGPCTKPSGHDGECERATVNGGTSQK